MRVTCLGWKIDFCVSFTYGLNKIIERRTLWDNLKQYGYFIANPWILLGDFNDVLSLEERIGGIHVQNYEIKDFVDCFAHLDLHDMRSMGCTYTWMSSTVDNKLDRVMINPIGPMQTCMDWLNFLLPGVFRIMLCVLLRSWKNQL